MDLETFLNENKLWYEFIEKPETIHTSDAAQKSGIDLKLVTKSLILLDQDKKPMLAIIPGDKKLSFSKFKGAVIAIKIRLVPFNEAENYSGYLPGATPMVYHKVKMKVVVDQSLVNNNYIYGGGGERTKLLKLKTKDVIRLNDAIIADICE